jgi:predicted DNA-binding antitoxin AbrB/MazE fold protein
MSTRFFAIVDHGVLRPTSQIDLDEGATVEVMILQPELENNHFNAAAELAELAKLANPTGDPATGRNHDAVIYGSESRP